MKDNLILVDENDQQIGVSDKWNTHIQGALHRAFSVFIFNSKGELLLQQRASGKYHCADLWTNSCCSHPMDGESTEEAARRRLMEEMGLESPELEFIFKFQYKAVFDNGLTEHEIDHVYFGTTDTFPKPNLEEVQNWKYMSLEALKDAMHAHPESFTPWLKICFERVMEIFERGMKTNLKQG